MADGARLESVYTLKRIVGSNPTSSDSIFSNKNMTHGHSIYSCGIVPLSKKSGEWKVFLIYHRGYEQYWSCPKGHLEPNETPKQAACRELKEETGLDVLSILHTEPLLEEFYWDNKGQSVLKRVLFFVAEVEGEIELQNEEIAGGYWFSFPEAMEKVMHPEGKATLKQAERILNQL